MRLSRFRFFGHEAGQSIIEFALAAPILVFGLIAGVDLLRVGAVQQAVINAARVGAEYAARNTIATPSDVQTQIWNELSRTPGLNAGAGPAVTACGAAPYNPACSGPLIQVGSPATFQGTTAGPSPVNCTSSAAGAICYVQVEVRYTFNTIVAWPLVPNQVTVDRTTAMPILR
jgi:Flp pilus assembly protein TadG